LQCETFVVAQQLAVLGRQGIGRRPLGSALDRLQGLIGAGVTLTAPVGQRRRIEPLPSKDGAGAARPSAVDLARNRTLSAAVNVRRRRGRSTSSGDAAGGAETSVGLRPSSFSAPPAEKIAAAIVRGMTMSMFHLTTSRVNFRGVDVSSSLARRVLRRSRTVNSGRGSAFCRRRSRRRRQTEFSKAGRT